MEPFQHQVGDAGMFITVDRLSILSKTGLYLGRIVQFGHTSAWVKNNIGQTPAMVARLCKQ